MLCLLDLDGTLDAYPAELQAMMQALRAGGHQVHLVTGVTADEPTPELLDAKQAYANSLGLGACFDRLVLVSSPDGDVSAQKAHYAATVGADIAIDNNTDNVTAYAAVGVPLALLTWQTRTSNVASRNA